MTQIPRGKARKSGRARAIVPLLIMGAMFVVSGAPQAVPALPAGGDKVLHAAAYAALGLTWCWALSSPARPVWRTALLAFAVAVTWGLSDEYHQSHVPGRVASWGDVAADAVGAALACGAWAHFAARARARAREALTSPGEA